MRVFKVLMSRAAGTAVTLAVLNVLAFACDSESPPETSAPSPVPPTAAAPSDQTQVEAMTEGQVVFISAGCGACHGESAQGTAVAPALTGHTARQVIRQARAPVGLMPIFTPDKVSNVGLVTIGEFITNLQGQHTHMQMGTAGADLELHHWIAMFEIEDDALDEARHHVTDLIDTTEGQHQAQMKGVLQFLDDGNTHDVEHVLAEMLAGLTAEILDAAEMHLRLALSSVRMDEMDSASHHMDHFLVAAPGGSQEAGQEILVLILEGRMSEAEHEVEELLRGTETDEHADEDEGHSEDSDGDHAAARLSEAVGVVENDDVETAIRELEEFIEEASESEQAKAQGAIHHLHDGELHEAEDILAKLMGVESHAD